MFKILLTVDDAIAKKNFRDQLNLKLDGSEILFVRDTQEAISNLTQFRISLVVLDLHSFQVDSLYVLAHMTHNNPDTPCFILGDHSLLGNKKELNSPLYRYFQKPYDLEDITVEMAELVREGILPSTPKGIPVTTFMQLVAKEAQTCLLGVYPPDGEKGLFFFNKGILFDAVCGELKAEDAARRMLAIPHAEIRFKNVQKNISRKIRTGLLSLIDEAGSPKQPRPEAGTPEKPSEPQRPRVIDYGEYVREPAPKPAAAPGSPAGAEAPSKPAPTKTLDFRQPPVTKEAVAPGAAAAPPTSAPPAATPPPAAPDRPLTIDYGQRVEPEAAPPTAPAPPPPVTPEAVRQNLESDALPPLESLSLESEPAQPPEAMAADDEAPPPPDFIQTIEEEPPIFEPTAAASPAPLETPEPPAAAPEADNAEAAPHYDTDLILATVNEDTVNAADMTMGGMEPPPAPSAPMADEARAQVELPPAPADMTAEEPPTMVTPDEPGAQPDRELAADEPWFQEPQEEEGAAPPPPPTPEPEPAPQIFEPAAEPAPAALESVEPEPAMPEMEIALEEPEPVEEPAPPLALEAAAAAPEFSPVDTLELDVDEPPPMAAAEPEPELAPLAPADEEPMAAEEPVAPLAPAAAGEPAAVDTQPEPAPTKQPSTREVWDTKVDALRKVGGYQAAALLDLSGRMLRFDSQAAQLHLDAVGATFNSLFWLAQDAYKRAGLQQFSEMTLCTPAGQVIVVSTGDDQPRTFHLLAIMAPGGDQTMMLEKLSELTRELLTSTP